MAPMLLRPHAYWEIIAMHACVCLWNPVEGERDSSLRKVSELWHHLPISGQVSSNSHTDLEHYCGSPVLDARGTSVQK